MKKLVVVFVIVIIAAFSLAACGSAPDKPHAAAEGTTSDAEVVEEAPTAEEAVAAEEALVAEEPPATEEPLTTSEGIPPEDKFAWDQDYISEVPPIMMIDPYFDIFGQSQVPVPYYYDDAVKLAGHSCGAVTGAWTITRKALEELYPDGEIPVRGNISAAVPILPWQMWTATKSRRQK